MRKIRITGFVIASILVIIVLLSGFSGLYTFGGDMSNSSISECADFVFEGSAPAGIMPEDFNLSGNRFIGYAEYGRLKHSEVNKIFKYSTSSLNPDKLLIRCTGLFVLFHLETAIITIMITVILYNHKKDGKKRP